MKEIRAYDGQQVLDDDYLRIINAIWSEDYIASEQTPETQPEDLFRLIEWFDYLDSLGWLVQND